MVLELLLPHWSFGNFFINVNRKNLSMYEHKSERLASRQVFLKRILINLLATTVMLMVFLAIGTFGYYYFSPGAELIDAFHNAAMILSGMGPVLRTELTFSGKIFSAIYALFSGILFITSIGYVLAPSVHRFFHRMHIEE